MKSWIGELSAYLPWRTPPALPLSDNRRAFNLVRAAVLASSVLLMLPGAWGHSVTVVEFAHLPAGLAAWQRHSLGIYSVCGPSSKFLYALPPHLAGVRVDYPPSFDSAAESRPDWDLGQRFQGQHTERYHDIYRWSRLLPILITVLGGCLICEWSTRLFGTGPGLVSLCLWCWMPPVLAHGSLVTSDMLSAVALVLAARWFWAFLLKPSLATASLAGLALGLAAATKFTLLILYPCWCPLVIGRAIQIRSTSAAESRGTSRSPIRLLAFALAIPIISLVVLDALYLFHDVGFRLAQWKSGQSSLTQIIHGLGERKATAWLLQLPLPIPLDFLRGLHIQLNDTERLQSAYLLGRSQSGGWWYWYAAASLFKVPLPAIALFGLALFRLSKVFHRGDPILWAALCLLLPAGEVAMVISSTTGTGTNAAFRYLLPSLALLCVWAGQAWTSGSRIIRWAVIGLLGWLALDAVVGVPDHLGWQNELGWASSRWTGRPALIGDSLDWGQDLARLGNWASRHSTEGCTSACVYGFGSGEPYGLTPPIARPASDSPDGCSFLAVSEQLLLDDNQTSIITISGEPSYLSRTRRERLLNTRPFDRVGRTIRIYRIRDLVPDTPLHGPDRR
jgi:hypothetical protein